MAGIPESFLKKHVVAVIQTDRICPKCDYNLRGLKIGGSCPECGTPILPTYSGDEPLSRMPLSVVRVFSRGAWLAVLSILIIGTGKLAIVADLFFDNGFPLIAFVAIVMWVLAMWMMMPAMTIPEAVSRGFCRKSIVRQIARIGQLGWLLTGASGIMQVYMTTKSASSILTAESLYKFGMVMGIIGMIALSVMMERLSEWVRDDTAEKHFQWFQWLLPLALLVVLFKPGGMIGSLASFASFALVLLFPLAVLMLAKSLTLAAVHSVDHQEREVRRFERKKQDTDELIARLDTMDQALKQDK